ncbi:hypothetical protein J7K19_07875 [bacterium]|nr:hypothetical protein [bacterium]
MIKIGIVESDSPHAESFSEITNLENPPGAFVWKEPRWWPFGASRPGGEKSAKFIALKKRDL